MHQEQSLVEKLSPAMEGPTRVHKLREQLWYTHTIKLSRLLLHPLALDLPPTCRIGVNWCRLVWWGQKPNIWVPSPGPLPWSPTKENCRLRFSLVLCNCWNWQGGFFLFKVLILCLEKTSRVFNRSWDSVLSGAVSVTSRARYSQ